MPRQMWRITQLANSLKPSPEHPSEKKSKIKPWKSIVIRPRQVKGNRQNGWGAWISLISRIPFFCKAWCSTFKIYQEVTKLLLSHSLLPISISLASHHKTAVACSPPCRFPPCLSADGSTEARVSFSKVQSDCVVSPHKLSNVCT